MHAEVQGESICPVGHQVLDDLIFWSLRDWPKVGMVGPMTNYTAAPQLIEAGYQELSGLDAFAQHRKVQFAGQALDVPRLTGFCLLIRRAVLEKTGRATHFRISNPNFVSRTILHFGSCI